MAAAGLGDLAGIVPQSQSLHQFQLVLDRVDARVGQPKAWLWAWIVTMTLCSTAGHSDLDASWSLDTNLDSGD